MPLQYVKRLSEYVLSKHPDMDTETAHEGNTENASKKLTVTGMYVESSAITHVAKS